MTTKDGLRRGVVSVLAMMFLVLFGSLALAMAIVSKGNLRTASTQLHVNKALSAAETGLAVARARLEEASSRFIVSRGVVDAAWARRFWSGSLTGGDGTVTVLPAPSGFTETGTPSGLAGALLNAHAADQNVVQYTGGITSPAMGSAPAGYDADVFSGSNWVFTPAVGIDGSAVVTDATPAAFQITYAPLSNGTDVRVIVTGFSSVGVTGSSYSFNGSGSGEEQTRPLTRTMQQDFRIVKQLKQAIISPSRVLIGKGVQITGNLGARYDRTTFDHGEPVIMRSDFKGLNATLDTKLTAFLTSVRNNDVDNDNRLRVGHSTEGAGIPSNATDYDGDGQPDNAFADATGDGYVDEFDVFMNHYDANRDGKVAMSNALRSGTPNQGLSPEFTSDDDLALQIDSAVPDRNKNGVFGFTDSNGNGRWDSGETILDRDLLNNTYPDQVLGWRDGVLDRRDKYAKLRGRMAFKVSQSQWTTDRGDPRNALQGTIVPPRDQTAQRFGATDNELPDIAASAFTSEQSGLANRADGGTFASQVASQLGISAAALPTYTEAGTNASLPRYWRSDLTNSYVKSRTGRDLWEKTPFNSPAFFDYYVRPRYENMTFTNVKLPRGNNGLFINCTFVGVTHVQSYGDNTHTNWSAYGKMVWNNGAAAPVADTQPLDKSDFLRYTTGNIADGPANYASFPDPPVINGATQTGANRDTKRYSNNIRFHDCLFVGSVVSDTPSVYTQVRNKLQFTGSTRFASVHPTAPDDPGLNPREADMSEIAKSSMMAPQYSVDIGTFNSPTDTYTGTSAPAPQNVNLSGTVIAGVLDVRGNTNIDGSLVLTFAPTPGVAPMISNGAAVGNPALFNCSLGYLGDAEGEGESIDPATLPTVGGVKVVGYDTDGDGIADVNAGSAQPAGSTAVPFYGYGRVNLVWNPNHPMPEGLMLPVGIVPLAGTYKEGKR
ncbi:MAG: hypothetical protein ACT4PL_12170 [Phycisphaerales bacterium]